MDFEDSPDEAVFRAETRRWLAAHAPVHAVPADGRLSEAEEVARGRAWQAEKAKGGYAAILLPKALGGRGGTLIDALIFAEEEARFALPHGFLGIKIGLNMALPAIMKHGTAAQRDRFAGPTIRGEMSWCQLFSEPGAGSDLAGLRTRALKDGPRWVVNGQKVWSSWAHHADWGILLARTDPTQPKHKGLSFFLVDMKTPGIEMRPIRQISGKSDFNETFFTDVVLPADSLVGCEGEGWACAMTVLMSERVGSAAESGHVKALIARAAKIARDGRSGLANAAVRARLAHWYAQEQGEKYFRLRLLTQLSKGGGPGAEAALVKLVYANQLQQSCGFAMEMQGYPGVVARPGDGFQTQLFDDYVWSVAMRIAGGADEVLKNQIAERVLGLPGDVRADKDVPFDKRTGG